MRGTNLQNVCLVTFYVSLALVCISKQWGKKLTSKGWRTKKYSSCLVKNSFSQQVYRIAIASIPVTYSTVPPSLCRSGDVMTINSTVVEVFSSFSALNSLSMIGSVVIEIAHGFMCQFFSGSYTPPQCRQSCIQKVLVNSVKCFFFSGSFFNLWLCRNAVRKFVKATVWKMSVLNPNGTLCLRTVWWPLNLVLCYCSLMLHAFLAYTDGLLLFLKCKQLWDLGREIVSEVMPNRHV